MILLALTVHYIACMHTYIHITYVYTERGIRCSYACVCVSNCTYNMYVSKSMHMRPCVYFGWLIICFINLWQSRPSCFHICVDLSIYSLFVVYADYLWMCLCGCLCICHSWRYIYIYMYMQRECRQL